MRHTPDNSSLLHSHFHIYKARVRVFAFGQRGNRAFSAFFSAFALKGRELFYFVHFYSPLTPQGFGRRLALSGNTPTPFHFVGVIASFLEGDFLYLFFELTISEFREKYFQYFSLHPLLVSTSPPPPRAVPSACFCCQKQNGTAPHEGGRLKCKKKKKKRTQ